MNSNAKDKINGLSRRNFLTTSTALATTVGVLSAPVGAVNGQSKDDPGPTNKVIDEQNPSSAFPPVTDAGAVPVFKYPFSLAHKRLHEGGWSREVTMRELPVSKSLAGVNMRLTAGGIRELHWHAAAEWAYMLYGAARITAIDAKGRSFVTDVNQGDLWYFPTGIPHSIQGLAPDGAEFLLVFDDGNFSEYATVLLSEWMAHTPKPVLAKNFGTTPESVAKISSGELFIFQAQVPPPLSADRQAAAGASGPSDQDFAFRTARQPVTQRSTGGEVRIIDSGIFKVSTTIAAAIVTVHPGGMRELHWHPNADEWQYYISGNGRMTVFATGARARTADFQAGDVGYVQQTLPHYIENTGDGDLKFLEVFKSSFYQDLALSEWLSHAPPELVMAHLNIDKATLDALPKEKVAIVPR
jgi:oxalate decarboxylase